jgi:hypothetical protein
MFVTEIKILKATCLQMSQNISIKSNLRKMYLDVRKLKSFKIQVIFYILIMCD